MYDGAIPPGLWIATGQMTPNRITIGEVLAGRFRVERELGAGGMGVVYAAWHLELDHPVAIKVVTTPISDLAAATTRFRREVRAAAKIRSEHVARVLDVGSLENGLPYMVLELLDGNDLEHELMLRGQLPIEEAVDYVLQAIEAIAEAHASGIIHRDLKPANLFLAERADKTRIVKVLDFGISKSILADSAPGQVSLTQTGVMMGSPLYMAPEQMQSAREVDARSDIWALGVVLYQLLTGKTPFGGASLLELFASIFNGSPQSLTGIFPDFPPELERTIFTCLQTNRELRYPNVGELAVALVDFAPPHARIHCERANRVLRPITGSSRASLPNLSGGLGPSTPSAVRAITPLHPSAAEPMLTAQSAQNGPVNMPETRVAWDAKTGNVTPRSNRKFVALGLALSVTIGAFVVWRAFIQPAPREHEPERPQAIATNTSPPVATFEVREGAASNATTANQGLPDTSVVPIAPESPSAMPQHPVAAPELTKPPGSAKGPRLLPKPMTPKKSAPVSATQNLPDYGGRR